MDNVRRELEKMRAGARTGSFPLKDGTRFRLNSGMAWEFVQHTSACIHADIERRMRPKPHPYYVAVTKAQDRLQALRMRFPGWAPEFTQHPLCPYNTLVLFHEGRLEDLPFADNSEPLDDDNFLDIAPIPYEEAS